MNRPLEKHPPSPKEMQDFLFFTFLEFLNFRALIFVRMIVKIFEIIIQIYYILLYRFNGTIV